MRFYGLGFGLLAASLASVSAQVTVEVTQEQHQFLQGEALPLAVRITNLSGQPLRLGAEEDWLTFSVEGREGIKVVSKIGDPPVQGEFVLESSKVAIKRVADLAPFFSLTEPGRYAVIASVRLKDWDRLITSPPKEFDIIEGARLWEKEVGIPRSTGDASGPPDTRRYLLQQANYLKGRLWLYLRVTEGNGKILRVVPIGPMVSFSRPEPQVDKASNLHVLYQFGPSAFSYTVFNPQGELVMRRTYDYISSRPRLGIDEAGDIAVLGGARRFAATDVPKPPSPAAAVPAAPAPREDSEASEVPKPAKP